MPLEPYDWNVTIVGQWNRAILTPQGIITKLFERPPDTVVQVEVPIDAIGPYRVTLERLTVIATGARLVIEPEASNYEELWRAMEIGCAALRRLPETPLQAVGINVNFRSESETDALDSLLGSTWDDELASGDFVIARRALTRAIEFNCGAINIKIGQATSEQTLHFNFERRSTESADHVAWLSTDKDVLRDVIERLRKTTGLGEQDLNHGEN
jgi:hypothetical protein